MQRPSNSRSLKPAQTNEQVSSFPVQGIPCPGATTPQESAILSEDLILEYQELHRQEYGQEITKEQAYEHATRLLGFYRLALGALEADRNTKSAAMSTYYSEVRNDRH